MEAVFKQLRAVLEESDIQPSDQLVEQLHNILVVGTSSVASSDPSPAETANLDAAVKEQPSGVNSPSAAAATPASNKSASAALPKGEDDSAEVVVTPKKGEDGSATSQDTPEPLSPVFVDSDDEWENDDDEGYSCFTVTVEQFQELILSCGNEEEEEEELDLTESDSEVTHDDDGPSAQTPEPESDDDSEISAQPHDDRPPEHDEHDDDSETHDDRPPEPDGHDDDSEDASESPVTLPDHTAIQAGDGADIEHTAAGRVDPDAVADGVEADDDVDGGEGHVESESDDDEAEVVGGGEGGVAGGGEEGAGVQHDQVGSGEIEADDDNDEGGAVKIEGGAEADVAGRDFGDGEGETESADGTAGGEGDGAAESDDEEVYDDDDGEGTVNNKNGTQKEGEAHAGVAKGDADAGDANDIGASDEAEVEDDDGRDASINRGKGEAAVDGGDAIGSDDDTDADADTQQQQNQQQQQEQTAVSDASAKESSQPTWTSYNLRIYHQPGKSGFEEKKDFVASYGTLVTGRYFVESKLGEAAFSTALKCVDLHPPRKGTTPKEVCLKVVKNNKDYLDQSLDEIQLLSALRDSAGGSQAEMDKRHVLFLLDFFYFKEHLFIVTELLGPNLYDVCSRRRKKDLSNCFRSANTIRVVAKQILDALVFVHSNNIIHCDIKPENILLLPDCNCMAPDAKDVRVNVKIIDFGSSCFTTDHLSPYIQSRAYRAPEVILGVHPYSFKIDIWSLGCVLAEIFTGYVLFQSDSVQALLARAIGIIGSVPTTLLKRGMESANLFAGDDGTCVYLSEDNAEEVTLFKPKATSLPARLHTRNRSLLHFVDTLLQWDPEDRPSSTDALLHPFILGEPLPDDDESVLDSPASTNDESLLDVSGVSVNAESQYADSTHDESSYIASGTSAYEESPYNGSINEESAYIASGISANDNNSYIESANDDSQYAESANEESQYAESANEESQMYIGSPNEESPYPASANEESLYLASAEERSYIASDISGIEDSPYVPAANGESPRSPSPNEETPFISSPTSGFISDGSDSAAYDSEPYHRMEESDECEGSAGFPIQADDQEAAVTDED